MTPPFETCPECGVNNWRKRDYDRLVAEKIELGSRFKSLHANHGLRQAEWTLREIELTESMKYMQGKVHRQAAAIRRLEDKLKRLGQRPYEEDSPEMTGM